jgi:flagellar basal-body rod protein FlgF
MSSGSQYIALSGLRARVDALDRLATDIANVGTAGYKGERDTTTAAERSSFDRSLQSAIDTAHGGRQIDMTDGAIAMTGRPLDVALDGEGFFVVDTPQGQRYTRNGHFTIDANRKLVTEDGLDVVGEGGPITMGEGAIRVDADGSVWAGDSKAGRLSVVKFADPGQLMRDSGSKLRAVNQEAQPVEAPAIRAGSLEQSNVSVAERLAELTTVSRGFEALQRSISMLMNDVDGRAIDTLGRRG